MAHLVFVHGVATRSSTGHDKTVSNRDKLFKSAMFGNGDLTIHNPLWGDLVPIIPKCVFDTDGGVGSFSLSASGSGLGGGLGGGALGGGLGGVGPSQGAADTSAVAKANATVALDAIFIELLDRHDRDGTDISLEQLKAFNMVSVAMQADEAATANHDIAPNGTKSIVSGIASDVELAAKLRELGGGEANSLSIGSAFSSAIQAITGRIRKAASTVAFDPLADLARPAVGLFLGDVFVYLKDGAVREGIRSKIRDALLAATRGLKPSEKLVVIGHSLGGVILLDMLLDPKVAGLPSDLRIDALFTVGSQPGLFQALGLYRPASNQLLPKPAFVDHWFNVYDPIDPLAFRANPIFEDVKDLRFDSITGLASAHTTYFKRPQFHARAQRRLRDTGVIA